MAFFRDRAAQANAALSCVLTLGDMIDGYRGQPERSATDLKAMLAILEGLGPLPAHHVLGNHCLSVPRAQLLGALQLQSSYYAVPLAPGWRLVVLDTTDMSLHSGHDEVRLTCTLVALAPTMKSWTGNFAARRAWEHAIAGCTHMHVEALSQCGFWRDGLMQRLPHAVGISYFHTGIPPNGSSEAVAGGAPALGGISSQQLQWLQQQLADAIAINERIIIACHHPLLKGSAPDMYRAWDADVLAEVLCGCPAVALVLNGHHHRGGAATADGLHFITFEGLLEAPPDSNAYGVVEVHADRIVIEGHGYASSRVLPLRPVPAATNVGASED